MTRKKKQETQKSGLTTSSRPRVRQTESSADSEAEDDE